MEGASHQTGGLREMEGASHQTGGLRMMGGAPPSNRGTQRDGRCLHIKQGDSERWEVPPHQTGGLREMGGAGHTIVPGKPSNRVFLEGDRAC